MASFTLYGGRGSTCTNLIRLTLAEGGFTDYETVYLTLPKGEQKVGGLSIDNRNVARLTCQIAVRRSSETSSLGQSARDHLS